MDVSARLAQHIARTRFRDLPATTVAATKRALIDGLGVAIAASGSSEDVRPFVNLARSQGGPREASILGSWERVSAPAAALANGAMAHALDYEDAFDAAPVHPNASLIPAALATAQAVKATGEELIAAVAIGCDLVCRLALSVGDALERAWYPPPILGAFGAAAAAARLRHATPQQVLDAFSLLLCQTSCPKEIKHSEHSVIRAVREAFPAQTAVVVAALASEGVRGFDQPLEGKGGFFHAFADGRWNPDPLVADLGKRFHIEALSFKPWPCCRGTHPYVEAAQRLRTDAGFAATDVKTIRASIGPVQSMLCEPLSRKRAPATSIDAKFSIPFTVASALLYPEVGLDSFSAERLRDAGVLALAQRVEPVLEERSPTSGALEIELLDGRRYSCEIEQALGHPTRPLSEARLRAKFVECATHSAQPMTVVQAEELYTRIASLEDAPSVDAALRFPD